MNFSPAELDALEAAVKAMTAGPYVVVEQDGVYWIDSTNPAFDEGREILAEIGWGPNAHAVALLLNRLESILAMARRTEAAEAYATLTREAVERLRDALRPLAQIADRFDDSNLDEHRPEWGAKERRAWWRCRRKRLSLDDALTARAVLAAEVKP